MQKNLGEITGEKQSASIKSRIILHAFFTI